ncbi:MAG: sulfate/molybdate ABC transporter ATP-binding protein [Gemmataceae bacterium]
MSIVIENVTKRFGKFTALDNVTLEVPNGQLVALLGPSGSGKTTLLRIIAGLEVADCGAVRVHDEDVTYRSARERNVGFVFQHYALFRHMTVFENIAFSLRIRRRSETEIGERVRELLHLIRLEGIENRYPNQLSGGQRQRIALARALAAQPRLLLLDEPFGALDAKVRQELRQWLRKLHDDLHVTSLFVTHDQEEAFAVADQVVVMKGGRIEQVGSPSAIFDQPANAFVMDFLGHVNVFPGRVRGGRVVLGDIDFAEADQPHAEGSLAALYVRPHELDLAAAPNGAPSLKAKVLHVNPAGPLARVQLLAVDFGVPVQVDVSHERRAELNLQVGDTVHVAPRKVRVYVPEYVI